MILSQTKVIWATYLSRMGCYQFPGTNFILKLLCILIGVYTDAHVGPHADARVVPIPLEKLKEDHLVCIVYAVFWLVPG